MKLDRLLTRYLRHLEVLNRTPATLRSENDRVRRFLRYLDECDITKIEEVTRDIVRAYPEELAEALSRDGLPLKATTRSNLLVGARSFLRWLHAEDLIGSDLSPSLTLPKLGDPLPKEVIAPAEMKRILAAPDLTTAIGYRDRVMLEVLFATGARSSELIAIDVRDVQLDEGLVTIRKGKGQKARVVPLGRIGTEMIEGYVKEARPKLLGDERAELLFLSGKGRPLTRQIVAERVRKHVRRAGIRKTITPHCFRVTAATSMLRNGANLRYVQELLGHATVETLGPYLRLTVGDLKEAHGRYHPRAATVGSATTRRRR